MYNYKNLPNILTCIRIFVIPVIVVTFYFDDIVFAHQLSAGLFLLASATDWLDGYLARKFSLESNFGKMLDPIADKLLVGSVLLMLVKFGKADEMPCLFILIREFFITGLREFLAGIRVSVPVSNFAKIKTFIQMTALFILLLGSTGSKIENLDLLGQFVLWVAAIFTLATGYLYFKASLKYFD